MRPSMVLLYDTRLMIPTCRLRFQWLPPSAIRIWSPRHKLDTIPLAHLGSQNMHDATYRWLRLPGKSIPSSSVESDIWLIRL